MNGTPPRVTVISGYFNRAGSARASVQSILDQSFADFEFLVFDDASTDETRSVLESIRDPRIRVIAHDRNVGFVRGMIDAVGRARGAYVAVHGSGDVSHPTRLERQVELLDARPEVAAVGTHRRNVAPDGTVLSVVRPDEAGLSHERLLRANVYSHGEVTFRRSTYDAVGGYRPQFTFAQDRDLWLRMSRVAKLAMVPEVLYDRVVQPDGVSFVPAKIVRQTLYSQLGVVLDGLPAAEQAALLARVDAEGIEAVGLPQGAGLVRRLGRKVAALGVAGRWTDASDLARRIPASALGDRTARSLLVAFARIGARIDPDGALLRRIGRRFAQGSGSDG